MDAMNAAAFGAFVIVWLVSMAIAVGFYVWYCFTLSRLFPKLGEQGWKGWVPIVNEMTILERGGVPGWSVVLYFLPIVNLYGMYLKAMAMYRIGQKFGQGAGLVVVGFLLPPLWAILVSRGQQPNSEHYGERIQGMMTPSAQAQASGAQAPGAQMPGAQVPAAPVVPAVPVAVAPMPSPVSSSPVAPAPVAPASAPVVPEPVAPVHVAPVPVATEPVEPVRVEPVLVAPVLAAEFAPKSEPEPAQPALIEPLPGGGGSPTEAGASLSEVLEENSAAPAPEAPDENPWAPSAPRGSTSKKSLAAMPDPLPDPLPEHDARTNVAELPTIIPSQHPGVLDGPEDDLDSTVVVDRRPVVQWSLMTELGAILALKSNSVLLGRKPSSNDVSVAVVAVPDETRTLSKNHARLDLREGVWSITDLNSTNGVILVAPDGSETEVPAGGSAVLTDQFILGNVSLKLVYENGS